MKNKYCRFLLRHIFIIIIFLICAIFTLNKSEAAAPSTGNINVLVLMADFPDKAGQVQRTYFVELMFGTKPSVAPLGSLADYYSEVSYGQLSITGQVNDAITSWYQMLYPYTDYVGPGTCNGGCAYPNNIQKLIEDTVTLADTTTSIDFGRYDNDGDGIVDGLIIIHAGCGAELRDTCGDGNIWSAKWETTFDVPTNDVNALGKQVFVRDFAIVPEYQIIPNDGTIGVIVHEFGHLLGLPDLYDGDGSSNALGRWSLMAGGFWNSPNGSGNSPAHPDAWSKIKLEWVKPTSPASRTITIPQVETNKYIYQLCASTLGQEYFLLENRQRTGFDTYLPGDGLAIYHIDEAVDSNDNEWYQGCPTCISHYKVALEQADGLWDLEKNINAGDGGDLFPGTTNNKSFNNRSVPDSKNYAGQSTGASVTKISTSGSTMTATVSASSTTASFAISPYNWLHTADVAFDGTNYFVVWSDNRNGSYNIYGSRVTPCGKVLDPGGIPISTGLYDRGKPDIAFDGKNYLIVWQDYRGSSGTSNIYGSFVSPSGQVITPGDFAITTLTTYEVVPSIAFDGTNYVVVWSDTRYDINNGVIMGTRITPSGVVLDHSGILISEVLVGQNQTRPSLAFGGNNYLVIWKVPPSEIFGAIVNQEGTVVRRLVVSSANGSIFDYSFPSVSFNPISNQFLASWEDYRNLNWDIIGQLINANGTLSGVNLPLAIGSESSQWYSDVAFDGNNLLVVWTDFPIDGDSGDIYGARISPSGNILDPNGKAIVATRNDEGQPRIACSGFNCLVVYVHSTNGNVPAFYGRLIIP